MLTIEQQEKTSVAHLSTGSLKISFQGGKNHELGPNKCVEKCSINREREFARWVSGKIIIDTTTWSELSKGQSRT